MRTLVIGDIHGAYEALLQVLKRSNYDPTKDKLIFLGDYVDGWSQSAMVIETLIDIKKQSTADPIFLIGNHDKWCKDWLLMGQSPHVWVQNGGKTTMSSYISTGLIVSEEHKKFFKSMKLFYIDDQNRGFVHGGFISNKGLGHEAFESDYYWDRDLWNLALISHNKIHEGSFRRFEKHKEVFIGHSATLNWKIKPSYKEYNDPNQAKQGGITVPMNRCNVWNVDTGAGFKGPLTILDIDTKEYWQSDKTPDLYPNELGRG